MTAEKHTFATEVQDLLHLMVHSLYSNKDIFLRELISNSSDALDRRRIEGLRDAALASNEEAHIRLEVDAEERRLSIHDNGLGMRREEVVRDLGTIARSGTRHYVEALKQKGSETLDADLIGQFGVGFYATFMVADAVTVVTRRAGESHATRWESTGDGAFTVEETTRDIPGTTVTLALKEAQEDDGLHDYTDFSVLREIVKKHSDFVAYPIRMRTTRSEPVVDDAGKPVPGAVPKVVENDETLNSMKAIWTRPRSEVSDEEYTEFYRHISHDWGEPLLTISGQMEGTFEARVLLFVPKKAPLDLYYRDASPKGIQLYVRRVFILDNWETFLPPWLRFVKGVVDAEDLSLNVSREILQQDRQVKAIRSFVVKKILDALGGLKKDRPDDLRTFWREFGPILKEGLAGTDAPRDRLLDLILCHSTYDEGLTSLGEYVERMPDDQTSIYYLTGTSLEAMRQSPHLESLRKAGREVLLFDDAVDEFWLQSNTEFRGKRLVSVRKGELEDVSAAAEADDATSDRFSHLLTRLRASLQDSVKEVRLSRRLAESPACLVADTQDLTPEMEALLRRMGQDVPPQKRILELNPEHRFVQRLLAWAENSDKDDFDLFAQLIYGQAILAEGGAPADPVALSRLMVDVMEKAVPA